MPRPNPLQSRGTLRSPSSFLDQSIPARDIERELKRVSGKCATKSGMSDYQYWRRRRAALLRAAQRYRDLTQRERDMLSDEEKYERSGMEESAFSQRLSEALRG